MRYRYLKLRHEMQSLCAYCARLLYDIQIKLQSESYGSVGQYSIHDLQADVNKFKRLDAIKFYLCGYQLKRLNT